MRINPYVSIHFLKAHSLRESFQMMYIKIGVSFHETALFTSSFSVVLILYTSKMFPCSKHLNSCIFRFLQVIYSGLIVILSYICVVYLYKKHSAVTGTTKNVFKGLSHEN